MMFKLEESTTDFGAIDNLEKVDFDALDAIDLAGDDFRRQLKSLAKVVAKQRGGDSVTVADVAEACGRLVTTVNTDGLSMFEPKHESA